MKADTIEHAKRSRWRTFAICVFLIAITWFVFGQTLRHEFTNYDDDTYVYGNQKITHGVSIAAVAWAFTHVHGQNWHPLTTISHMLDCQFYGIRPAGHHATNVLLHTIAVLLLFGTCRRMTGTVWRSAVVAALFAVHPLRVESVAWIAERKDVLSGVFFTLTLGGYKWYTDRRTWRRYMALLALFTCGLMSKPMLVTTPVVLLLLDRWPLGRLRPREKHRINMHRSLDRQFTAAKLVVEKLPLLALSGISAGVTLLVQRQLVGLPADLPLTWRFSNAATSYAIYIGQMFWPTHLAVFYPHPENTTSRLLVLLAFTLLLAITVIAVLLRNRAPYVLTGWLWYVVMLVPVIGIVQVGWQGHADRYTYLPLIGLYLVVVWGIAERAAAWQVPRPALGAGALLVVVCLASAARVQASYWRDSETLWRHTLAVTSRNDVAENNLGIVLMAQGKLDDAIAHFQAALSLRSANAPAHDNLAKAFLRQGRFDDAIFHTRQLVELEPDNPEARANLGTILAQTGRVAEAVEQWRKTLVVDPNNGNANNNVAWVYATCPDESLRNGAKAVEFAERAVRLSTGKNAVVLRTASAAYAEVGRFGDAISLATRARELAVQQGNTSLADELARTLELYANGVPIRDYSLTNRGR